MKKNDLKPGQSGQRPESAAKNTEQEKNVTKVEKSGVKTEPGKKPVTKKTEQEKMGTKTEKTESKKVEEKKEAKEVATKHEKKEAPKGKIGVSRRSRLEEIYRKEIVPDLKKKLELKNVMAVPKISKVVLNVGVKEAVNDSKSLQVVAGILQDIAGQLPVRTLAKKSIAGFKIREGMPLGLMVTLRKGRMYDFLDKLINVALPKVRDFHGVPAKFDGHGNYNLGIKDCTIFPEADTSSGEKYSVFGINVTICTTAHDDKQGVELLRSFGMPFKK